MKGKMIIGIITGAILLFLAIGFYNGQKLQTIEITKTISIRQPAAKVYEMISRLSNYPKWSPFLAQDPAQQYSVKGPDGAVGVQFHWNGNKGKDIGYQEIIRLEEHRFIGVRCHIEKPFKAQPTFDYTLKQTGDSTEVIQYFKLESGLVDGFFMWVFGAKKEMAATNQQGLELLKKATEG